MENSLVTVIFEVLSVKLRTSHVRNTVSPMAEFVCAVRRLPEFTKEHPKSVDVVWGDGKVYE